MHAHSIVNVLNTTELYKQLILLCQFDHNKNKQITNKPFFNACT